MTQSLETSWMLEHPFLVLGQQNSACLGWDIGGFSSYYGVAQAY